MMWQIFGQTRLTLSEWTRQVQALTYDAVLIPVRHILRTLPAKEVWGQLPRGVLRSSADVGCCQVWNKQEETSDMGDLPSFSMLPQVSSSASFVLFFSQV